MPSAVDPVVRSFVEAVNHEGAATTADTVGGLFLRLINRVGALEKTVEAQATRIERVAKLARQQKPVRAPSPTRVVESGVDTRDGGPVYIEQRVRRSRGRPKGVKDSYQRLTRSRHSLAAEVPSSSILDRDWDDPAG
jgi:hypothetical protein